MTVATVRPSVKITKSFLFRGALRYWSNRYYITGPAPDTSTRWTTLCDAVTTAEKATLPPRCTIVKAEGFLAGSDVPVFTKTYALAGTFIAVTSNPQQGEVVALVRYSTADRTAKNHPIYFFNYYHGVFNAPAPDYDLLVAAQRTAFQTYAAAWVAGFNDGSYVQVRTGPQGHTATGSAVDAFLTHRDFPRD